MNFAFISRSASVADAKSDFAASAAAIDNEAVRTEIVQVAHTLADLVTLEPGKELLISVHGVLSGNVQEVGFSLNLTQQSADGSMV